VRVGSTGGGCRGLRRTMAGPGGGGRAKDAVNLLNKIVLDLSLAWSSTSQKEVRGSASSNQNGQIITLALCIANEVSKGSSLAIHSPTCG
jgi:hypothetical protein